MFSTIVKCFCMCYGWSMENITLTCDRCGGDCSEGYEIQYHGERDRETGYIDQEIVCRECLDEDVRYDCADLAYELSVED